MGREMQCRAGWGEAGSSAWGPSVFKKKIYEHSVLGSTNGKMESCSIFLFSFHQGSVFTFATKIVLI